MKVQCNHCGKKYTLPAERVAGRILKIRCRQCSNLFEVDGSQIVLTEQLPNQVIASIPQSPDSGVTPELKTQEFSAIETPKPSGQAVGAKPSIGLPETQPNLASAQANQNETNTQQLSVEVSQSAQEWMESVMSDVNRPITREIKLNEITGHRSLPPESRSSKLVWLFAIIILLGLGYLVTQINSSTREKPKVLSLTLSAENLAIKDQVESDKPVAANSNSDASTPQSLEKVTEKVGADSEAIKEVKTATNKKRASAKTKGKPKAQLNDLNQALNDLKKSSLATSTPTKIEISGNLEGARKKASESSKDATRKSSKVSKSAKSKKGKAIKSAQKSRSKNSTRSAKAKQAKRAKSKKPSKKKVRSRKSGKGLDYSTVSAVMNQNAGGLENCYRKALKKDSSFGEVKTRLKFKVSPEGRVARKTISLSGVYRRTRFESCIQNTVVRWYFPKAKGETPVRYPLNFTPGF